jgi:hypothetical protein
VMIVRHIGPRGKRRSIPASERKWAAILQADVVHKSCVLSALAVERLPAPPPDVSNEVLSLWNKSEADALIAEAIRWLEKVPTPVGAGGHQRRWILMDKVDIKVGQPSRGKEGCPSTGCGWSGRRGKQAGQGKGVGACEGVGGELHSQNPSGPRLGGEGNVPFERMRS